MTTPTTSKTWRLLEVLKEATHFLKTRGIENPRLNAERLMGQVLNVSRVDLYLQFEQPLSLEERALYKTLLKRRAQLEPLQYILGESEFMSLNFKVTPDVLIPRPETEILVEQIINNLGDERMIRILDIGTGCSNIAVSLAKHMNNVEVVGIDSSEEALEIARENVQKNGVDKKVILLHADVNQNDFNQKVAPPFDLVVSNPPYVSIDDFKRLSMEMSKYEPRIALCDEGDGYTYFHLISRKSRNLLKSGGRLYFEVGDGQSENVQGILMEDGYKDIRVISDLNGIERVVAGECVY